MKIKISKWVKKEESKLYNLSFRNLIKKVVRTAKKYVKIGFAWLHKKLSQWEDTILDKITEWGEKAANKMEVRLNGRLLEETIEE